MYQIQGFQQLTTQHGCDAERSAATLADARKQAKYMRSEEYRRASEAAARLALVQIWKDNVLLCEMY